MKIIFHLPVGLEWKMVYDVVIGLWNIATMQRSEYDGHDLIKCLYFFIIVFCFSASTFHDKKKKFSDRGLIPSQHQRQAK